MVLNYCDVNAILVPLLVDCGFRDRERFEREAENKGLLNGRFDREREHYIYIKGARLKASVGLGIDYENEKNNFSKIMHYLEILLDSDLDLKELSNHVGYEGLDVRFNKDGALDLMYSKGEGVNRVYLTKV